MTSDELAAALSGSLPDGPLVVALGGGADSAVAAWLAASRGDAAGIFVRHGLDGSADLESAASELAERLEMPVRIVDALLEPGASLEDRARQARWAAIGRHIAPDETVVTGHTLDDQAETVLMNLLRGAGSGGIAGMEIGRPGIARPLLGTSRSDVRDVADELGLPYVDDPANERLEHLRNRIRHRLLPHLEEEYRPEIRRVLARAGELAARDDATLEDLSAGISIVEGPGTIAIPAAPLSTVSRAVASRVVRRALRRLLTPYAGTRADVDGVLAVASGDADTANVSGGYVARREGLYVVVAGDAVPASPVAVEIPSEIRFGGMTVTFRAQERPPVHRRSTLYVDPEAVTAGVVVRAAADGDRLDIGGGTKPVREILAEHGVPVRRRPAWPVVATGARIVAVVGIRIASWARPVTSDTIAIALERNLP